MWWRACVCALVFHGCAKVDSDALGEGDAEPSLSDEARVRGNAIGLTEIHGWEIGPKGSSLCKATAPLSLDETSMAQRAKFCNRRAGLGVPATLDSCKLACKNIWNCRGFTWYAEVADDEKGLRCQLIGVPFNLRQSINKSAISYIKKRKVRRGSKRR